MIRSGTADLPLHYGKVPEWLAARMAKLGLAVSEAVISEYGTSGWISRMSDPFWFQALGCVMGMDWHSSGITTSVLGALKRAINPLSRELGIHICGGRGKYSRQTPAELLAISDTFGTPGRQLAEASRLSAKVDNSCIQDGFQIYLHTFSLSRNGQWAVVQQGMNKTSGMARRYHWHSANAGSFVDNPQTGIVGRNSGEIINFSDRRAGDSRNAVLDFINTNPALQRKELQTLGLFSPNPKKSQLELWENEEPSLTMPRHHEVLAADVSSRRLGAVLTAAYDKQFSSFTDALLMKGIGPRTMQSLALVCEVVYGKPNRFSDPARFSFAHGGKDGHPFPVPLHIYDKTISIMKQAVKKANIGNREQLDSLHRLHKLTVEIETSHAPEADIDAVIQYEKKRSEEFGGRTVFS